MMTRLWGSVTKGVRVSSTQTQEARADSPRASGVRLLFIGGWGRSGSTLVERLLGEMPEITGGGEITHMWLRAIRDDERCSCGAIFSECPFWCAVGESAFNGWANLDVDEVVRLKRRVDRMRYVPRLALPTAVTRRRDDLQRYLDIYRCVYRAIAEVSGASVVIDSSKHASLAFALRHDRDLDLRVLHLVRDSRGVAYSWSKAVRRPEVVANETLMPQYSIIKSAVLWTCHNALFHLLSWVGTPTLRMRYEQLIDHPADHLVEIRKFVGLPGDAPAFIDDDGTGPVAHLGMSHSVSGNPMRFQSGAIRLRRDAAWRTEMPAGKRRLVSLLTWPSRVRYGYLDRKLRTPRSGA
jgi:hypothetical protein